MNAKAILNWQNWLFGSSEIGEMIIGHMVVENVIEAFLILNLKLYNQCWGMLLLKVTNYKMTAIKK